MMTKTRLETRGSGRHSYVVNVLNKNYANTWTWLLDHCNALASSWIKWFKVFNIYWISNFHLLTKMKPSAIKARVQCLKNSRVVIWNWSGQTLARRSKLWLWKANLSLYLQLSRFVNPPFKINVGRRISISHCLFHSFLIAPTSLVTWSGCPPHCYIPGSRGASTEYCSGTSLPGWSKSKHNWKSFLSSDHPGKTNKDWLGVLYKDKGFFYFKGTVCQTIIIS